MNNQRTATVAALAAAAVLCVTTLVAQTPDVSETAQVKGLAAESLLLDVIQVDGRLVAVGERGHILISDDDGATWQQCVGVPTRTTLTGVWFHDRDLGWAVGHDAVILRTRDGGQSWELLNHAPEEERPFLDVWFADANRGFAVGAYGFFYATNDGGDTWEDRLIEPIDDSGEVDPYDLGGDFHLNHIARDSSGRLYLAAEAGTIYRSDDDGDSWRTLPSPYQGSFFGSLPLDGDSLLLFGLRGNLFRSDDAGETWQTVDTGTVAILNDGIQLTDGTVVVAGTAGTLLVSDDGGSTFRLAAQADRQALAAVVEAADGSLVLAGEFGANKLATSEL